jgi:hypothetical protein
MDDDLIAQAEKVYDRLSQLAAARPEQAHYASNLQTPIKCALEIIERDGTDAAVHSTLQRAVHRAWEFLYGV